MRQTKDACRCSIRVIRAVAIIVMVCSHGVADAQGSRDTHPYLGSKYMFDAGAFFPQATFEIGVDASIDAGSPGDINFETAFRSDVDETLGAVELAWRFGEKWSLQAQYFNSQDRASAVLDEDVTWGDVTFGAGTAVVAGFNSSVSRLFLGRSFIKDDRQELGAGFGGHVLDVEAFVRGDAIINGLPVSDRPELVKTSGIVPNLGAWYIRSISPKWAFKTRLDWLRAVVGNYDGYIVNAAIGVNLQAFEYFGFGVNYNWIELDLDVDDASWHGDLKSRSRGFFVYLSAYW